MALFQGLITLYDLSIQTPNIFTNYKSTIAVHGSFGLAFLNFVPDGGELGVNGKRDNENVFDIYFFMSSWLPFVDMLHHEKEIIFFFEDEGQTAQLNSTLVPPKS